MAANNPPPKAANPDTEVSQFTSVPWCASILSDPAFAIEPTIARIAHTSGMNNLLARTLHTSTTISGWCSLYRRPATSPRNAKDEVRTLLAFGRGLDGYQQVCHGGVIATVLDEVMSVLVCVCRESLGLSQDNLTAELNVKYVKPVPTPVVVCVNARVKDIQKERKYFLEAQMVDSEGIVLARGEALFICVTKGRL